MHDWAILPIELPYLRRTISHRGLGGLRFSPTDRLWLRMALPHAAQTARFFSAGQMTNPHEEIWTQRSERADEGSPSRSSSPTYPTLYVCKKILNSSVMFSKQGTKTLCILKKESGRYRSEFNAMQSSTRAYNGPFKR